MPTDRTRFVNPGADAGGDGTTKELSSGDNTHAYVSQSIAEAAEQTADADLVTGDETLTCLCAGTVADNATVIWDGWTVGVSNFITVKGDRDQSDGFYDGFLQYHTGFYRMEQSGTSNTLQPIESFTVIDGIQIRVTKPVGSAAGIKIGIRDVVTKNCRIFTTLNVGSRRGIWHAGSLSASSLSEIENCIVAGFVGVASSGVRVDFGGTGTVHIFNCSIYDCNVGILNNATNSSSTVLSTNNVLFNNTDDHSQLSSGPLVIDHCATEQGAGEGTNAQTITTPTDDMEDPENATPDSRDVRLKTTGVLEAHGTTGAGIPTVDIIGTARDGSTPDIGAWEIVAVGGGVANPWYAYAQQ